MNEIVYKQPFKNNQALIIALVDLLLKKGRIQKFKETGTTNYIYRN